MKRFRLSLAAAGIPLLAVALVAGVAHSDIDRPDTRPRPKVVVKKPTPLPAGPAGKDATFRGSFARTGEGEGKISAKPRILWTAVAGGDIGYPGQPVMADGMVFSGTRDSAIFAFDASTGRERWKFETGGGVYTSPTYAGGVVYAGSYDNKVYALDARTGDKKWSFDTGDIIEGAVCVLDDVVYAPSFDGKLYAIDAKSGKKKWSYDATGAMRATPACVGDTIYIGADGETGSLVAAVNRATGKRKWEFKLEGGDNVTLSVAVSGKTVLMAGSSGRVYALDAGTGKRKWTAKAPGSMRDAVAVGGGLVLACTQGSGCSAFDLADGGERWKSKAGDVAGSPAYGAGYFYAPRNADGRSEVIAMDAKTGTIAWKLSVDGTSRTSIGLFDGVLLHGTEIGNLYAIGKDLPVAWGSPMKDPFKKPGVKKKGPPPEIACDRKLTKEDLPAFPLRGWVDGRKWEFADGAAVKKGAEGDLFLVNHPYKSRCSVEFSDPDDSVEVGIFLERVGEGVYSGSKDVEFMNYRSPGADESKDESPNVIISFDEGEFKTGAWVSGSIAACFADGSWVGGEFSVPVCKE